jgi:hypothetical protein
VGKTFITDEVNDVYTAKVTTAGKLLTETAANSSVLIPSAYAAISAAVIYAGPCYLKSLTLNYPISAASLIIYDTAISAGGVSGFGTSGDNIKGVISFPIGHASAISGGGQVPVHLPINCYMTSGLSLGNGGNSANNSLGYIGVFRGGTVTYQVV